MKLLAHLSHAGGAGFLASLGAAATGLVLRTCTSSTEAILAASMCGPGQPSIGAAIHAHCHGCVLMAAGLVAAAGLAGLSLARTIARHPGLEASPLRPA